MIESEEKNPDVTAFNITLLRVLRSFLLNATPILTKELTLGNLRRNNNNDFVYGDLENYMGKLAIRLKLFKQIFIFQFL